MVITINSILPQVFSPAAGYIIAGDGAYLSPSPLWGEGGGEGFESSIRHLISSSLTSDRTELAYHQSRIFAAIESAGGLARATARFASEMPIDLIQREQRETPMLSVFADMARSDRGVITGLFASAGGGCGTNISGDGLKFNGLSYRSYKTAFSFQLLKMFAEDDAVSRYWSEAEAVETLFGEDAARDSDKVTLLYRAIWLRMASLADGIPEEARELFQASEQLHYQASKEDDMESGDYDAFALQKMLRAMELVADDHSPLKIGQGDHQFILIAGRRGKKRDEKIGATSIEAWFLPYRIAESGTVVPNISLNKFVKSEKNRGIQAEEVKSIAQKFGNLQAQEMVQEAGDDFADAYLFAHEGNKVMQHWHMAVGHAKVTLALAYLYKGTDEANEFIDALEDIVSRLESLNSYTFHAVAIEYNILIQTLFKNENAVRVWDICLRLEKEIQSLSGALRKNKLGLKKRVQKIAEAFSGGKTVSEEDSKFLADV